MQTMQTIQTLGATVAGDPFISFQCSGSASDNRNKHGPADYPSIGGACTPYSVSITDYSARFDVHTRVARLACTPQAYLFFEMNESNAMPCYSPYFGLPMSLNPAVPCPAFLLRACDPSPSIREPKQYICVKTSMEYGVMI